MYSFVRKVYMCFVLAILLFCHGAIAQEKIFRVEFIPKDFESGMAPSILGSVMCIKAPTPEEARVRAIAQYEKDFDFALYNQRINVAYLVVAREPEPGQCPQKR
jgi:hypothetical protein